MTTPKPITAEQPLTHPKVAGRPVEPPQRAPRGVKRERLGGTLDMAALKALRGSK